MLELATRDVVAFLFVAAAVAKWRYHRSFIDYLRTPFGRWAGVVSDATIGTELVLGIGLSVPVAFGAFGFAAAAFVLVATATLAVRLTMTSEVSCHCWTPHRSTGGGVRSAVTPALHGARNGLLVVVALRATMTGSGLWLDGRPLLTLIAFSTPGLLMCMGMAASIRDFRRRVVSGDPVARAAMAEKLIPLVALGWWAEGEPRVL
jgi:hypothetical protein